MKFPDAFTEGLYLTTLDGGADEECGTVDLTGWFGRIDRHILAEDSQGFVDRTTCDTVAQAERTFDAIRERVKAAERANDTSDPVVAEFYRTIDSLPRHDPVIAAIRSIFDDARDTEPTKDDIVVLLRRAYEAVQGISRSFLDVTHLPHES